MDAEIEQLKAKLLKAAQIMESKTEAMDEQIRGAGEIQARLLEVEQRLHREADNPRARHRSAGGPSAAVIEFANSDGMREFLAGNREKAMLSGTWPAASLVTDGNGTTDDDGYHVPPQYDPNLRNDPRHRLTLLDVLPRIAVKSGIFQFSKLDGYVNLADEQANEGAEKPETRTPTELESANIATIAHLQRVSTQLLADSPALLNALNSLMVYGTRHKAESLLIAGTGQVKGLETLGTAFMHTFVEPADRIGEAGAALEGLGWIPTHAVFHPDDWQRIRSERDNENSYVTTGWQMPPNPSIWGMSAITSPWVTEGTAIVMDTMQVALLDRQDARFEAFFEDRDNVIRNLVTLRAELRIGLAVFAPSAVMLVDVASS